MYDLRFHKFTLQLGFHLVCLCSESDENNLLQAITILRRSMFRDQEIAIPEITIRDHMNLEGGEYVLLGNGRKIARGKVFPDFLAAFSSGNLGIEFLPNHPEVTYIDPASNHRVVLIRPEFREIAENQGYLVVDAIDLLISHLSQMLLRFAHESTSYRRTKTSG